MTELTRKG